MIRVEHVSKFFLKRERRQDKLVHALDDVSVDVEDRRFVCLIGPSGCGKTTLLKLMDGLDTYNSGSITIDGKPVRGPGPDRAMVFQNFALLPWRDALSNVELGLHARGIRGGERRERALRFVKLVGLGGFEHHYPHELSGGMQQRVGLARALAVQPNVMLMDEPFGALDEQTRRVLQDDLTRVWEEQRHTVVFVTHSMEEAVYLADEVVIMSPHPGRVKEVIQIKLARPRAETEVRKSKEFAELTEYIWERLRDYSRSAMLGNGASKMNEE